MNLYKNIVRPILFKLDPEPAHNFTFGWIRRASSIPGVGSIIKAAYGYKSPKLEREVFGIRFPNPVGLAAGLDKEAQLIDELANMGFGFIEIGTLTPVGQPGNPEPRMFRLPEDKAVINRMGFNNQGVEQAVKRLRARKSKVIVGGNIGKNKVTPNERATEDYEKCFEALYDYVDYFVVNVSSPNTPNLRALQEKEPLKELLSSVKKLNEAKPKAKPILLKIAPDLTDGQLDDIIEIVGETGIDGVIATNTTIDRSGLTADKNKVENIGAGGLSGAPVTKRSTEVIRYLHEKSGESFPIIGVGGIMSPQDAIDKLKAGASLIQIYTGFIYEGPGLVKRINKAVEKAGL
ncbi:dihydroorotate dehydrogenase (quinone) [Fulvitalea axinellae]|uniref:Dihydroorotate dehydrogenase (quinone) n=1 Tax=Fulvitalea axinellae TaxID=1182444 RepID=A0AAU9D584_9BACT|nr:dihydroorotate dehydrogenase (quinone) [Fulvitalea axinellae]